MTGVKDGVTIVEAGYGSDLYAQALRLREEILRRPLGLLVTDEERADDALRQHFCAVAGGEVIGSVSLRPLGPHTLQLRQMAVSQARRGRRIGARLLNHAEAWGRGQGFQMVVLNARIGGRGLLRQIRLWMRRRAVRGDHPAAYQDDQAAGVKSSGGLNRPALPRWAATL